MQANVNVRHGMSILVITLSRKRLFVTFLTMLISWVEIYGLDIFADNFISNSSEMYVLVLRSLVLKQGATSSS